MGVCLSIYRKFSSHLSLPSMSKAMTFDIFFQIVIAFTVSDRNLPNNCFEENAEKVLVHTTGKRNSLFPKVD